MGLNGQTMYQGMQAADSTIGSLLAIEKRFDAARSARQGYEHQESMHRFDAATEQYEAAYSRKMAAHKAKELVRNFSRSQGVFRTHLAVSGVTMGDGSALDALMDRAGEMSRQKEMVLHQGEMDAWRHQNNARVAGAQAELSSMRASNSKVSNYEKYMMVKEHGEKAYGAWSAFS